MSDQPHHPSCGPEPHLHTLVFPAAAGPGACVIMVDHVAVAMCDPLVAERLLQLILEHGLLAVPRSARASLGISRRRYGQRWLGGFLRFGDLLAAGDTEHWYVEHSSRRCLRPLASRDGDFVMDLEQAIKIAAGEIPAPGYGPTVYSTEVPSEAPLE